MKYRIDFQNVSSLSTVPSRFEFKRWVELALCDEKEEAEVCIRIVDEDEMKNLNHTYRKKEKTTNVLSFPYVAPPNVEPYFLGDIIVCASVIEEEAKAQGKQPVAHWAHMVIHGILHLLGYDHVIAKDANIMEAIEIRLLRKLGFPNPYELDENEPHE